MDKFEINLWNGSYYAKVRFPDGSIQELNSKNDLTYTQWKVLIDKAWEEKQKPEPTGLCLCPSCTAKICPKQVIK